MESSHVESITEASRLGNWSTISLSEAQSYAETLLYLSIKESGCYTTYHQCFCRDSWYPIACGIHFPCFCLFCAPNTIPFSCCMPYIRKGPGNYINLKHDSPMVSLDAALGTKACYFLGYSSEKPCCICVRNC